MIDIYKVADEADMIVNGYAFKKEPNRWIRVLNLNRPTKAAVMKSDGEMIETTMDDIEMQIVVDLYNKNKVFLEDEDA